MPVVGKDWPQHETRLLVGAAAEAATRDLLRQQEEGDAFLFPARLKFLEPVCLLRQQQLPFTYVLSSITFVILLAAFHVGHDMLSLRREDDARHERDQAAARTSRSGSRANKITVEEWLLLEFVCESRRGQKVISFLTEQNVGLI